MLTILMVSQFNAIVSYLYFNLGNIYLSWSMSSNPASFTLLTSAGFFFEKAKEGYSPPPLVTYKQGQTFFLMGEQQLAIDEWRQFPEADCWLKVQGISLLKEGRLQEAGDILQTASMLNPASSAVAYYVGMTHYRSGANQDALAWLERAVELNQFDERCLTYSPAPDVWWPGRPDNLNRPPSLALTYIQMAAVYYTMREWDAMQAAAQKAVALEPENPLGYYQLGEAYYRQALASDRDRAALLDSAEAIFAQVVDVDSNFQFRLLVSTAQVHRAQGNVDAAILAYQRALPRVSQTFLRYEIAEFFAQIGYTDEAAQLYELALDETPLQAASAYRWVEAAAIFAILQETETACEHLHTAQAVCSQPLCDEIQTMLLDICQD